MLHEPWMPNILAPLCAVTDSSSFSLLNLVYSWPSARSLSLHCSNLLLTMVWMVSMHCIFPWTACHKLWWVHSSFLTGVIFLTLLHQGICPTFILLAVSAGLSSQGTTANLNSDSGTYPKQGSGPGHWKRSSTVPMVLAHKGPETATDTAYTAIGSDLHTHSRLDTA